MISAMGLPQPSGFPTPEEVRAEAQQGATQIFDTWRILNKIVERHESTIRKRWLKKTKDQRKRILLASWPHMPETHRPDFQFFIKGIATTNSPLVRDAFMWPYINQEDLLKPKIFLLLLNSRSRNKPAAFSRADNQETHFGHVTTALVPIFLNEHVMMFTGRDTPETYGELIAWDDHPDAFDWMHTKRGTLPGEVSFWR